jgi:DTW domain-containing protein YfiP
MARHVAGATRCIRCRMHTGRCICAQIPHIETRTKIVIMMHPREWPKTTATAPLLADALANCTIHMRSSRGVLAGDTGRGLFLFPLDECEALSAELLADDPRPVTLVVPDGTWKQARKIAKRHPDLQDMQRIRLPQGPTGGLALRRRPAPDALCTFEAVIRALAIIEPDAPIPALQSLLDAFVSGTLASRGLPPGRAHIADRSPPPKTP